MSNTKWRSLFELLHGATREPFRWKFIRDSQIYDAHCPHPDSLLADSFGDTLPFPYGAYKLIDWIEIPTGRPRDLIELISSRGKFPVVMIEDGLRIEGYTWK